MFDLYIWGVFAAFVLNAFRFILAAKKMYSMEARNYARIECFYDPSLDAFYKCEKPNLITHAIYRLIICSLMSWLSFFSSISNLVERRNSPTSPDLKKFDGLISEKALDEKRVTVLFEQRRIASIEASTPKGTVKKVFTVGEDYSDLTVIPSKRLLVFEYHAKNYDPHSCTVEEYKIEDGLIVLTRTISRTVEGPGYVSNTVRDGVVNEDEIKNIGSADFEKELRASVEWHPSDSLLIKAVIVSAHPELLGSMENRKLLRLELEQLKSKAKTAAVKLEQIGMLVSANEKGFEARYPTDWPESSRRVADSKIEILENDLAIKLSRIARYKDDVEPLEKLLA